MFTSLQANEVLVFTKLQKYSQKLDENPIVPFVSFDISWCLPNVNPKFKNTLTLLRFQLFFSVPCLRFLNNFSVLLDFRGNNIKVAKQGSADAEHVREMFSQVLSCSVVRFRECLVMSHQVPWMFSHVPWMFGRVSVTVELCTIF